MDREARRSQATASSMEGLVIAGPLYPSPRAARSPVCSCHSFTARKTRALRASPFTPRLRGEPVTSAAPVAVARLEADSLTSAGRAIGEVSAARTREVFAVGNA